MKYYLDTEFIEGPQDKKFLGLTYGKTKPTIDLISIGIVSEVTDLNPLDHHKREYYAISKDFNLDQAWKDSWIKINVLLPIFKELMPKSIEDKSYYKKHMWTVGNSFSKDHLKDLIEHYGKTNKQIAQEIKSFIYVETYSAGGQWVDGNFFPNKYPEPEFWAYYADYDWVVFCQLFGRMIDLPKGFPMYCRDLKQQMDALAPHAYIINQEHRRLDLTDKRNWEATEKEAAKWIKNHHKYPKQKDEHNALADARWNKELHQFLINL